MGLHAISDDGFISWHCDNPQCIRHNCADPLDSHGTPKGCEHHGHLPADQRPDGEPQRAHISHDAISWLPSGIPGLPSTMIALPQCDADDCSRQLFVKAIFTDEELSAPNMAIPEYEECREQVVDRDNETLRLALAKHGIEIPQVVHLVKQRRVVGEHQHPMVPRHQALAEQLKAIGKHPPQTKDSL